MHGNCSNLLMIRLMKLILFVRFHVFKDEENCNAYSNMLCYEDNNSSFCYQPLFVGQYKTLQEKKSSLMVLLLYDSDDLLDMSYNFSKLV